MNKHINVKITGQVHGVGFRFSAYEKFVELGLLGRAENVPGGGVLLDTEGLEEKLEQLIEWCKKGPNGSRVENVEVREIPTPFVPQKNS